ncbi:DUF2141 domain-containing protein [Massilia agri]|uniref:DUF2141 domain-containing protein n=1 Tax=Massilia agri TaxID=1886785 RepID=A0ABT2ANC8_9BURK|nr:DUF2141 domain-containing protein [Massilia agri]MCS0597465.1 DUF2141 domain-containing protein [Massilia agri]
MRSVSTVLLAFGLVLSSCQALAAITVEVRVSGVTAKGTVNVAVCDRERFLKQCAYSATAPAQAGETVVTLKDIPAGTWAVLAYQDENGNKELDRNFIGIPKENYGFSRNPVSRFGPPSFEDAAIALREGANAVAIKLH